MIKRIKILGPNKKMQQYGSFLNSLVANTSFGANKRLLRDIKSIACIE